MLAGTQAIRAQPLHDDVHGCGRADEYPSVAYEVDFAEWSYDGGFEENMAISMESYIGEQGAAEGLKLEEQLLLSKEGVVKLSSTLLLDMPEVGYGLICPSSEGAAASLANFLRKACLPQLASQPQRPSRLAGVFLCRYWKLPRP